MDILCPQAHLELGKKISMEVLKDVGKSQCEISLEYSCNSVLDDDDDDDAATSSE